MDRELSSAGKSQDLHAGHRVGLSSNMEIYRGGQESESILAHKRTSENLLIGINLLMTYVHSWPAILCSLETTFTESLMQLRYNKMLHAHPVRHHNLGYCKC